MSIEIIFFLVILVMSVVIHEVAHGYMANFLGDPTAKLAGRLTLNPIPHIDPFGSIILPLILSLIPGGIIFGWAKPVPFNPYNLKAGKWGPALVALAGPASNFILALFFSLVIRNADLLHIPSGALILINYIVLINIVLMVFNLIPVPPLDGSKILFAILPYKFRNLEVLMVRNQIILIIVVLLVIGAVLSPVVNLIFWLMTGSPLF